MPLNAELLTEMGLNPRLYNPRTGLASMFVGNECPRIVPRQEVDDSKNFKPMPPDDDETEDGIGDQSGGVDEKVDSEAEHDSVGSGENHDDVDSSKNFVMVEAKDVHGDSKVQMTTSSAQTNPVLVVDIEEEELSSQSNSVDQSDYDAVGSDSDDSIKSELPTTNDSSISSEDAGIQNDHVEVDVVHVSSSVQRGSFSSSEQHDKQTIDNQNDVAEINELITTKAISIPTEEVVVQVVHGDGVLVHEVVSSAQQDSDPPGEQHDVEGLNVANSLVIPAQHVDAEANELITTKENSIPTKEVVVQVHHGDDVPAHEGLSSAQQVSAPPGEHHDVEGLHATVSLVIPAQHVDAEANELITTKENSIPTKEVVVQVHHGDDVPAHEGLSSAQQVSAPPGEHHDVHVLNVADSLVTPAQDVDAEVNELITTKENSIPTEEVVVQVNHGDGVAVYEVLPSAQQDSAPPGEQHDVHALNAVDSLVNHIQSIVAEVNELTTPKDSSISSEDVVIQADHVDENLVHEVVSSVQQDPAPPEGQRDDRVLEVADLHVNPNQSVDHEVIEDANNHVPSEIKIDVEPPTEVLAVPTPLQEDTGCTSSRRHDVTTNNESTKSLVGTQDEEIGDDHLETGMNSMNEEAVVQAAVDDMTGVSLQNPFNNAVPSETKVIHWLDRIDSKRVPHVERAPPTVGSNVGSHAARIDVGMPGSSGLRYNSASYHDDQQSRPAVPVNRSAFRNPPIQHNRPPPAPPSWIAPNYYVHETRMQIIELPEALVINNWMHYPETHARDFGFPVWSRPSEYTDIATQSGGHNWGDRNYHFMGPSIMDSFNRNMYSDRIYVMKKLKVSGVCADVYCLDNKHIKCLQDHVALDLATVVADKEVTVISGVHAPHRQFFKNPFFKRLFHGVKHLNIVGLHHVDALTDLFSHLDPKATIELNMLDLQFVRVGRLRLFDQVWPRVSNLKFNAIGSDSPHGLDVIIHVQKLVNVQGFRFDHVTLVVADFVVIPALDMFLDAVLNCVSKSATIYLVHPLDDSMYRALELHKFEYEGAETRILTTTEKLFAVFSKDVVGVDLVILAPFT